MSTIEGERTSPDVDGLQGRHRPVAQAAPRQVRPGLAHQVRRSLATRRSAVMLLVSDVVALSVPLLLLPATAPWVWLSTALTLALFAERGLYRPRLQWSLLDDLPAVVGARLSAVGVVGVVLVVASSPALREMLQVAAWGSAALLLARAVAYLMVRRARLSGRVAHRCLVVGGGAIAGEAVDLMSRHGELGLLPVGYVDDRASSDLDEQGCRWLGGTAELDKVIVEHDASVLLVTFGGSRDHLVSAMLRSRTASSLTLFVVPRLYEVMSLRGFRDHIGAIPVIRVRRPPREGLAPAAKRAFDVVASLLALVVLSPVMLACAVAVRTTGPGVLFRQERVGQHGELFELLKFRSMRPAEDTRAQTAWSAHGDPRLTRVGRLLRRTSLDELPQLWNILRGRDDRRRPAAGAAVLRRAVLPRAPPVRPPPPGTCRADGHGPGERAPRWGHLDQPARPVRQLLHRELVPVGRHHRHLPHRGRGRPGEGLVRRRTLLGAPLLALGGSSTLTACGGAEDPADSPADGPVGGDAGSWLSGSSGSRVAEGGLGRWRGRDLDLVGTWADVADASVELYELQPGAALSGWRGPMDIALGAIAADETWADAAAGGCDDRWRRSLTALAHLRSGAGTTYVRFAHESNGDWYDWSVDGGSVDDFLLAWDRYRDLQLELMPQARLVFAVTSQSSGSGLDWRRTFPGPDAVDLLGVDHYNQYPWVGTREAFDDGLRARDEWGAPRGLGAHAEFAAEQGVPFCVPEWSSNADMGDSPAFIEGMHRFFTRHGGTGPGQMEYEVLFNVAEFDDGKFALHPDTAMPEAAETYQELW